MQASLQFFYDQTLLDSRLSFYVDYDKIAQKRGSLMEFQIGDERIPYTVIESNRKSVSIEITREGQVLVRVPRGIKEEDLRRLIKSRQRWIYVRVMAARERKPTEKTYETGRKLLFLGQEIELLVDEYKSTEKVFLQDNKLHVWIFKDHKELLPKLLEQWYRKEARKILSELTYYYAKVMHLKVNQITIKDQKTRWGSCSVKHNLNYNYRLVMAPKPVIEYVVIHELCHMIHMNHSKDFWCEVEKIQPEYKYYRKWLKEHQYDLQL